LALLNLAAAVSAAFCYSEDLQLDAFNATMGYGRPLALWIIVPLLNVWAILSPRQ
jgi:hypothetical protein